MLPSWTLTCETSPHFYPLKLRTDPGPGLPASQPGILSGSHGQPVFSLVQQIRTEQSPELSLAGHSSLVSRAIAGSLCCHALSMAEIPLVSVSHSQAIAAIPMADTCQEDPAGLKFCQITSASLSWFPPAYLWFPLTEITTAIPVPCRQDRSLHCFFFFFFNEYYFRV